MQLRLHRIDLEEDLLSTGATGQLVHHLSYNHRGFLVTELSVDLDDFVVWLLELFNFSASDKGAEEWVRCAPCPWPCI